MQLMAVPVAPSTSQPETRAAVLGRFLRGSVGSGVAVGARAAGALLLNKLLAVYGGPGGLTLLAHFQNLMALFTTLPNDGIHVGVVKYLAPLRPGSGRYRAWLGAGLVLNTGALLLGAMALVLLPGPLVGVFQMNFAWTLGLLLGLVLLTGHAFVVSVLLAAGRLQAYVGLTVLLSLLGPAAVALVLAGKASIPMALLAYLLAQGLTLGPALVVAGRAKLLPPLRGRVSRQAVRTLGRFLVMALSVLLFGKSIDFSLREVLIRQLGLAQTDLWQAVAKLSDNYTMVFSAVMGSVYYPRLAALSTQPALQRQLVRTVLSALAAILAVGLGTLWLVRGWLLPLLFDERFAKAGFLLAPQLLGDWAKFLTWTLLFLMMAQAKVGRYVAVQAGSAVLYAALLAVLLPHYGLLGAPLAHAARFGVLLVASAVYFRGYLRP
ncbi:O-antigen translocase [Hymenobacter tenuis]